LRNILGIGRVFNVAQGHRIDEIQVALDQFVERGFRLALGVFPQQETVVHIGHLLIIGRRATNWDNYFDIPLLISCPRPAWAFSVIFFLLHRVTNLFSTFFPIRPRFSSSNEALP
jgi:hypothetical protein